MAGPGGNYKDSKSKRKRPRINKSWRKQKLDRTVRSAVPSDFKDPEDPNKDKFLPVEIRKQEGPPPDYKVDKSLAYLWCRDHWWSKALSRSELQSCTNTPSWQMHLWITEWRQRKDRSFRMLEERHAESNLDKIQKSFRDILEIVDFSLSKIKSDNEALTVSEISALKGAAKQLFDMAQTIKGEPSSITGIQITGDYKTSPWEALREKLQEIDAGVVDYQIIELEEDEREKA